MKESLFTFRGMMKKLLLLASHSCFILGFLSILGSISIWYLRLHVEPAHAERFGIFVGLWAPTFFILSTRLEQYARQLGDKCCSSRE